MKSYIASIGIATPEHCFPQMKISRFMEEAVPMNEEEKVRLRLLYRASGINQRYTVLSDFGKSRGEFTFFPNSENMEPFPSVSERMKIYKEKALPLSIEAINNCLQTTSVKPNDITHLITVSCTGMYAPGLDIELVESMGLNKSIQRTCINYMGCYAAFNALKVANAFCLSDPHATVLIVCVELCTIHYQKIKDWDHLLSNALFGDGAAAVLVQGSKPQGSSLSLESFYCDIASEGKKDMAWHISDFGFEMTLSSYIPQMIRGGIQNLTRRLLDKLKLDLDSIDPFAIHPGGKKILEVIEEELKINKDKNRLSHQVLREFGNMSSPTVLFVLYYIFKEIGKSDQGKNILSFAFGPGLTLESMLLKVSVNHETSLAAKTSSIKEVQLD